MQQPPLLSNESYSSIDRTSSDLTQPFLGSNEFSSSSSMASLFRGRPKPVGFAGKCASYFHINTGWSEYLLHYRFCSSRLSINWHISVGEIVFLFFVLSFNVFYFSNAPSAANVSAAAGDRVKLWALGFGHTTALYLAITMIPVSRNSFLTWMFGIPFERAIRFHRVFSRAFALLVWIHASLGFYIYGSQIFSIGPQNIYGIVAGIVGNCMMVFAIEGIRRFKWEYFYFVHKFGAPIVLFFAWYHILSKLGFRFWATPTLPILTVTNSIYVFDILFRVYQSRLRKGAKCKITKSTYLGDVLSITFSIGKKMILQGGEYFMLNIPALSFTEWHPYSILSTPSQIVESGLVRICVRVYEGPSLAGQWNQRLAKYSLVSPKKLNYCLIEGPYGRPSIFVNLYPILVFFGGGIGAVPLISHAMAIVEQNTRRIERNPNAHIQNIVFCWTVKNPQMFQQFEKEIEFLSNSVGVSMILYATQFQSTQRPQSLDRHPILHFETYPITPHHWVRGRPNFIAHLSRIRTQLLDEIRSFPLDVDHAIPVGVLACGPKSLVTTASIASCKWDDTVHFHFHSESFEL